MNPASPRGSVRSCASDRLRAGLRLAEASEPYRMVDEGAEDGREPAPDFPEATLTALWLLGRVPATALGALTSAAAPAAPADLSVPPPELLRVLHVGRAGRGPGPDVREAAFLTRSGAVLAGDVEVHLRASDFVRHGHAEDPAYAGVVLHLCWVDDRQDAGTPTALPGGGAAPTLALASHLAARDVERLVALGPDVDVASPPCSRGAVGADSTTTGATATVTVGRVRDEGRKRLAERTWRAWRLADRFGFDGALAMLLERAVASTAGRVRESEERRGALVAGILEGLGDDPVEALARLALEGRTSLVAAMRVDGLGEGRAGEVAWNVAPPLIAALAAAYDDVALARATAELADGWPAPRPYGRTRALAQALRRGEGSGSSGAASKGAGALYAQGLLHLQDLWCSRGGCGVCPLSGGDAVRGVDAHRLGRGGLGAES